MEHAEFIQYCNENGISSFGSGECESFKIFFKNGEWAEVHAGIDGLYYTCSWIKYDSTKLREQLNELAPSFIEDVKKKYENLDASSLQTIIPNYLKKHLP